MGFIMNENDPQQSKIADTFLRGISSWYFVFVSLTVFSGLLAFFSYNLIDEGKDLRENLQAFHNHPYSVRIAASDLNVNILETVHIWSGYNGVSYSEPELEILLNRKFALIDSLYSVIKTNYLGPKEDVNALWESVNKLKSFLVTNGFGVHFSNHQESLHADTEVLLRDITNKLDRIEKFAINKAEEYMAESSLEEGHLFKSLEQLIIAIILFFIIIASIAAYIFYKNTFKISTEKKKFSKSIKYAPIPIMIHKNGIVTELSDEWLKLTGYSSEEISTIEKWSSRAYGKDQVPTKEFIYELYKLKEPQDDGIWKVKTKSGEERIWRFHSGPLDDESAFSTAIDVTEEIKNQKKIELLNEELLKLAKVVDQSPVSIVITDIDGNIEYVNDYFEKITGYTSEEAIGENPRILKSGIQDKKVYENLWQTISNGEVWRGELQNKAKDGTIFWESVSISPVLNESGDVTGYVAVKENITHQITLNQQLVETNKKLTDAQEIGNIGNWIYDVVSESTEWSEQLFEIYDREIEMGSPSLEEFRSYHVETEESFRRLSEALEQGKAYDELITLITKQGEKKYLRSVGIPKYNDEEKLVQFTGVAQDVTKRRNIELQLFESESRLKSITDNLEGLILRYALYEDGSNEILYISKGIEELHGVTQEQVLNDSSLLWGQIAEEDVDRVQKCVQESAKNLTLWDCKWRIKTPGDFEKWVHGRGTPRKGEISGSIIWDSLIMDITNEVIHEESLKKTNVQLQASQDIARIGHWSFDVADGEVYLSPIVREIHEMDKNVSVNEGFTYYKEGYDRERIEFVVKEAIENGIPYKEELKIVTEKGNERWVRTNGVPIMKDGKCVQVSGTFMDITQEKEREQKLKDNLKEKEVMLAEIHHRVKNNLAIISAMLELQAYSSESPHEKAQLTLSTNRIKSIAFIHEQLYKSGNFATILVEDNIKNIIDGLITIYSGKDIKPVTALYDLESVSININQAVPLSLLMNEIATNSFKHAFKNNSNPELKVSLRQKNQNIELSIRDNGVGFDVDKYKNSEKSLGHTLIELLVIQIEGNIDIQSTPGNGTNTIVTFAPSDIKGSSSYSDIKG